MSDNHQYGLPDLRQLLVTGRTNNLSDLSEPFFLQTTSRNLVVPPSSQTHYHHHDSSIILASATGAGDGAAASAHDHGGGLVKHGQENYCNHGNNSIFGLEMENGWINNGNDVGNNSRWPRQETLTLLEIRSRLDSRFKEANQKGPLWDDVSRIMAEEHGYQRSGKKCREKFENLYKYYKKTKEGKAGRQDGKNYRFFRQLEALYGDSTNNNQISSPSIHNSNAPPPFLYQPPPIIIQENQEPPPPPPSSFQETNNKNSHESLSFSNTSEFETSSSDNNDDDLSALAYNMMNRNVEKSKGLKKKKNWKGKVKEFVDLQMGKLLEKQEAWMERMVKTIEDKEKERVFREEEWIKQEMAKLDQIHEHWAKEKAWVEARDVALIEGFKKYIDGCNRLELSSSVDQIVKETQTHYRNQEFRRNYAKKIDIDHEVDYARWSEPEIFSLLQIRTALEARFQESRSGYAIECLWEEIGARMRSLGYNKDVEEIKEKWENMNFYFNISTTNEDEEEEEEECNKKRKEDLRATNYFQQLEIGKLESLDSSSSCAHVVNNNSQIHGSNRFPFQIHEGSSSGTRRFSNFRSHNPD